MNILVNALIKNTILDVRFTPSSILLISSFFCFSVSAVREQDWNLQEHNACSLSSCGGALLPSLLHCYHIMLGSMDKEELSIETE